MARNILVVGLGESCINLVVEEDLSVGYLKERICQREHVDAASFFLVHNGAPLEESASIEAEDYSTTIIRAYPIVRGGKGGFGSLIRAIGMQINKSNNKQACRDLSGRRVRDINAEKKVAKWLKAEPERRKKLEEEKKKRQTMKKGESKHYFEDHKYMEQIRSTEENMGDALKQGLEAASSSNGVKRKQPASSGASKKPKLWLGLDEAELDSDESSGIEDENGVESAASRSSGGGSPDSMHGSGDGPGPSGLQNVGCSSQEMLRDNNPHGGDYSNTSSPEPGDGEDLPILLPAKTERETDEVEDKSERMDVEVRAEIETEEIKRPEIVVEEKVGSDGRASAENNSGENGEEESKRSSPSVQEQENGTEVSEERERTSPSVQQQENGTEVSEERERTSQEQSSEQAAKQEIELEPIDLDNYSSVEELELAGPERLKAALQALGLKCGGTLQQRAQRLFSTKGKTVEELHPSLFAKASKQRRRKT